MGGSRGWLSQRLPALAQRQQPIDFDADQHQLLCFASSEDTEGPLGCVLVCWPRGPCSGVTSPSFLQTFCNQDGEISLQALQP